jgi:hemoglobin/transferrin/lactoferrin receptor protein
MKHMFFLWLLLGWTYLSNAQTVTITDQQTGRPLEGVVLISGSPGTSVVTNAEGQSEISSFRDAEEIQIRSIGYKTQIVSFHSIQDSGYRIALEISSLYLDQVVVSATRWRQTSGNVPSMIVSILPEAVALLNPQTAADLLGISGKVFIQKSQQGGGSPMIRGFATNRLFYSVDGVRMNTAIFRAGNLQNVINLDPFATGNTEILFGPGSVTYGSDAIGGVMSFQTLIPKLSLTDRQVVSGKAVMRYSSASKEKTGHFDVNIGWKKWAMVTSFSSWDFDNLKQGSHGPDDYVKGYYVQRQDSMDVVITQDDPLVQTPSAYSQVNLMQKVHFQPNERWNYEYGFHYSETSPYGRYDRHNRLRNGLPRYAEWDYGPQVWMMNNLFVNHQGRNAVYDQMTLRLAQQSFEESRIDRSLNDNDRNTQTEHVEAYSVNLDFVRTIRTKHQFFYGFEYVINDIVSKGVLTDISTGIDQTGPTRYPQSSWSSLAAYMNSELRVSDRITLQAGLRYNQFTLDGDFSNNVEFYPFPFTTVEINKGALTGGIGGVYRPSESWLIRTSFGTGFRSPNVDDMGKVFDSEPGSVTVPNPELEAEYAYNFDIGISRIFGEMARLDLTGYCIFLQNAMVRRDYQLNGQDSIIYDGTLSRVQAVQNAAVAKVYGVQAGIEITLPAGFVLISDLNYQKGEEELDDGTISPSRHAAPLFGVSRLRYQNRDITLELNVVYQGEKSYEELPQEEQGKDEIYAKDADGNNYSPVWYTLNMVAKYQLNETFSVSSGIENLTDQRYRPYSSGISGAGRNFILSVQCKF